MLWPEDLIICQHEQPMPNEPSESLFIHHQRFVSFSHDLPYIVSPYPFAEMFRGGRKKKIRAWISDLFTRVGEIQFLPDGPQQNHHHSGFFNHAKQFTLHHPAITYVQGDYSTVNVEGDPNATTQAMKLLSEHIIRGAAHDSSARDPPPRCHPHTRVQVISRITAWFDGHEQQEMLLWITGPAGVGKSAIVQTFSEYLAKRNLLGAAVFVSRPNKRNNSHGVFLTVAYQLATRIGEYRNFIVEQLRLDPDLPNKGIQAQFEIFIVEPFVHRRIGTGGKRWGILLDGLDELEGEDAQCDIIRLINTFAYEHRDTPLVWIIASRPEPHIFNTFDDDEVRRSSWSEYIPINSTEACEDVERFLQSSFEMTRKKFRHSVPNDWPDDAAFLKLAAAASGLFIYAEVVMQFIRDSYHSDPVLQLKTLLSVIDRSNDVLSNDRPFVHLDALYKEILSSIPSQLWPITKQLLGFVIHWRNISIDIPESFNTLRGMSIIFGLTPHIVYACLSKCHSTLGIPDWKVAHKQNLKFLHASFADYLTDSRRSGVFHISAKAVRRHMQSSLLNVWNLCSGSEVATTSVESAWHEYCSKCDDKASQMTSSVITKFHTRLFYDLVYRLKHFVTLNSAKPATSRVHAQLWKIHMIKLCYYSNPPILLDFVWHLLRILPTGLDESGLIRNVQLGDVNFGHLDRKGMSPAQIYYGKLGRFLKESGWILHRPRSNVELKMLISRLESVQQCSPELRVIIFGGIPEGRVAVFKYPLKNEPALHDFVYYIIPYPE